MSKSLEDGGFTLLSTVDPRDQELAEEAVAWGLERLKGRKSADGTPLQAALVAVDPHDGAIRAYVGGRDFRTRPFDRAGTARRQAGSAFKPVVYAAAFDAGTALPSTLLYDSPLTLKVGSRQWSPKNSDGKYRSWVTCRTALEKSLNVPTVRLALDVGVEKIVQVARRMGVEGRLSPVPSLALGAVEVTPLELASIYATLAEGGARPRVHGLTAVLDGTGLRTLPAHLPARDRPMSAEAAFMVTSILQGALQTGTGRSARSLGLQDRLAGKTGTTNDRRDSWFAGYSRTHVAVVWVGHDDNSPTGLTGAQAALPIWVRYFQERRPPGGYPEFVPPRGIRTASIDPTSGLLATDRCPVVQVEAFPVHRVPTETCHLHQSLWQRLQRRF